MMIHSWIISHSMMGISWSMMGYPENDTVSDLTMEYPAASQVYDLTNSRGNVKTYQGFNEGLMIIKWSFINLIINGEDKFINISWLTQ